MFFKRLLSLAFSFISLISLSLAKDHVYSVHKSHILSEFSKTKWVRYFEVELHDPFRISDEVGPYQWDANYDKISPMFNYQNLHGLPAVKGRLMKDLILSEHYLAYHRGEKKIGIRMDDAQSFFQVIKKSVKREIDGMRFTYIIDKRDDGRVIFRFSPTGKKKLNFVTKHVVLSKISHSLIYSGEFVVNCLGEQDLNMSCKMMIDNKSGTYKPLKDDLPKIIKMLKNDFWGLEISPNDKKVQDYEK